jgi:hypothetical protein
MKIRQRQRAGIFVSARDFAGKRIIKSQILQLIAIVRCAPVFMMCP